jgi:glycerol-3-phosphate dehydrogenase (NAD(P)+)
MNSFQKLKIGIVGAGSWGTALANMLAEKGLNVTLWVYEKELLDILLKNKCNIYYLPDLKLEPELQYTNVLENAVRDKQIVLWVTPVKAFRKLFEEGLGFSGPETIHVSASKGIENDTLKTVSQIAEEHLSVFFKNKFVVLSGPSFAREVSKKMPTAAVIASKDKKCATIVQQTIATPYFRTYTSEDILGVELGGALKNVIALASGISDGLGYGHNTRAALITRGLAEIIRLGGFMGANPLTFSGLSGMGDLVLTCTSCLSRNYSVGVEIGKGAKIKDILNNMKMIAEGVYTTKSAFDLSLRNNIEMPIVHEIFKVLFENKPPLEAVKDLMGRDLKKEII